MLRSSKSLHPNSLGVRLKAGFGLLALLGGHLLMDAKLVADVEPPLQRERRLDLTERAILGEVPAMMQLAQKYQLEGDKALAIKWFRKAADEGHTAALWKLVGIQERRPLADRATDMKALYEELIESGELRAYHHLGRLHQWPESPIQDVTLGDFYLKEAAKLGVVEAQLLLGKLYMGEWAHPLDYFQAIDFFSQAAKADSGEACRFLGLIYRYGLGVKTQLEKGWQFYSRGAKLGDMEAMYVIAEALYKGDDIEADKIRSHSYYHKAAQLGHREAAKKLKTLNFHDKATEKLYP